MITPERLQTSGKPLDSGEASIYVLVFSWFFRDEEDWAAGGPGNVAGFSLHAGVAVKAEPGISMTRPAV